MPDATWNDDDYLLATDSPRHLHVLSATHDLKQLNSVLNQRQVCLDLVFSSLHGSVVTAAKDLLLAEERHHPTLSVVLNIPNASSPQYTQYMLDFRRCDLDATFRRLQNCDLPVLFNHKQADHLFTAFCSQLSLLVNEHTHL